MKRPAAAFAAGLALVAVLPFAARALRHAPAERCALDGVAVASRNAVRIVDEGTGPGRRFCCVACAENWLAREGYARRRIFVVDEETGAEIDARSAWFVESLIPTEPATGCRIHVFGTESAATSHAEQFRGRLLVGNDVSFRHAE